MKIQTTKTKAHKVKRDKRSNSFCGPAVLSIITGKHVDEVTAKIRELRGHGKESMIMDWKGELHHCVKRTAVRGTQTSEISEVLRKYGYIMLRIDPREYGAQAKPNGNLRKPTVALFSRKRPSRTDLYLVVTTNHWCVIQGNKLYDNCNTGGVFIGKYGKRRKCVVKVWKILKANRPFYINNLEKTAARASTSAE